jgi:hypothetical protein
MARLAGMAYDTELADRIRFLIGTGPGVTEKKMFGGLAFLVGGNMAISASGQGGVLVRVDPAPDLVATQPQIIYIDTPHHGFGPMAEIQPR